MIHDRKQREEFELINLFWNYDLHIRLSCSNKEFQLSYLWNAFDAGKPAKW